MKNNTRISRINDEVFKEISQIVRGELKDPRIGAMTSVVRVDTTQDLKYCKVYVSVLGDENQKASVMKGLKKRFRFHPPSGGRTCESASDTGTDFQTGRICGICRSYGTAYGADCQRP